MSRPKAATLAVGTEVTDGQITDRNSAWISHRLVNAGLDVIEHRAVADDRDDISRALRELSARVDLLFVTGGLGPTSDDFTRDLLSEVFEMPLKYDEDSWQHIVERFKQRGIEARPIQKQQCYFPEGARVLKNNAGTANAFALEVKGRGVNGRLRVYGLPGPPIEIATVWADHLEKEMQSLVPLEEREELTLYRTLGSGESAIAELVEEAIAGTGLRVGYRAHQPYVEVKLWAKHGDRARLAPVFARVELAIAKWIVGRGETDAMDSLLEKSSFEPIHVRDLVTRGIFQERVQERMRARTNLAERSKLTIETAYGDMKTASHNGDSGPRFFMEFQEAPETKSWKIRLQTPGAAETTLEVQPTPIYGFGTDRGRKYFVERALHVLIEHGALSHSTDSDHSH